MKLEQHSEANDPHKQALTTKFLYNLSFFFRRIIKKLYQNTVLKLILWVLTFDSAVYLLESFWFTQKCELKNLQVQQSMRALNSISG